MNMFVRTFLATATLAVLLVPVLEASGLPNAENKRLSEALGSDVVAYDRDRPEKVNKEVLELLSHPLNMNSATRVALLNNRRIQSTLQELLAARADLRQSRLLPNPEVEASLRGSGHHAHNDYAVTEDVLGLVLYPWKRRAGTMAYTAVELRTVAKLQEQLTEVKTSFIRLQSLLQSRQVLEPTLEAAKITTELTTRQRQAGNISALGEATQNILLQEVTLRLMRADAEAVGEREHVRQLLGLEPSQSDWTVEVRLPALPKTDPTSDELKAMALETRPELAAARAERTAIRRSLSLSWLEFIPSIQAGVGAQKEEDVWRSGPVVRVSVPIFNRGQAIRGRLTAEGNQKADELWALEIETQSQINADLARMDAARKTEAYLASEVIPLRQKIVSETQKNYNFMLAGIYQLLQAKQQEIMANREVIDARRDYWIARSELERTIGRPLPATLEDTKDSSPESDDKAPDAPSPTPEDHQGENHEN